MVKWKGWVWRWGPPLVWMGLIFALSAQPELPRAPGPWLDTVLKKTGHAVGFGVLALLYLRALRGGGPSTDRLRVYSLLLALAYAAVDETHQAFVPGRTPSVTDVLIDGIGAAIALGLERWIATARAAERR